ncbi:hypothetical protein EAG_01354 [Camponotus floridanus]|uniref:SAP domain-containing protein n=1 Tax=Camponotus floridanus TaxID=104421 RepID=E1ZUW2_CAMFO|nr:hypothetical protein EAG_01354 [Camponotus floridanus]
MQRAVLDGMSLEQLKEEAARYQLSVVNDRARLIDSLMTHFEKNSPAMNFRKEHPSGVSTRGAQCPTAEGDETVRRMASALEKFTTTITTQMRQQQQVLQNMTQVLNKMYQNGPGPAQERNPATAPRVEAGQESELPRISPALSHSSLAMSHAHAVNLLASQIPEFNGSDEDNVRVWVQRVDRVARIHQVVTDDFRETVSDSRR